ncbi:hypothetical protein QLQ12_01075 [Actinoplanes sp. NEAU-A12]|uniref:Oxidoreductase n=1 Tax=Actinoplanes sandaracinus TaxID=3045177 RepID=A0ABT6WBY1_9ACTN|nr:hypothetical protein [Actinoplanes sandaracinus]MDI6097201.1 hypothetical protein [Actinoplanes sandaracinus]
MIHTEEETVIVGAGMAGLAVSAGARRSTFLIESGTETDPSHKNILPGHRALDLWHRTNRDKTFKRHWSTSRAPHFRTGSGLRQRVGGRSLYWHGVCLPIEDRALLDWPAEIVAELTSAAPHACSYATTGRALNGWLDGHRTGHRLDECRGPREESFLAHLRSAGFAALPVPQAAREVSVDGEIRQLPYSPLTESPDRPRRILTGGRVLSVVPHGDRFRLTVAHGRATSEMTARRVVLAAGTIENTRLVAGLRMHIRNTREMACPGLNDHIVQGFVANVPRGLFALPRPHGRVFCYLPALDEASSNLFWEVTPIPGSDTERLAVWTMGEKLPGGCSVVVRAAPRDRAPRVHIDGILAFDDLTVVRQQARLLGEVAERLLGVQPGAVWTTPEDYARGKPSWMEAVQAAGHETGRGKIRIHPYVYPLGSVDHESGTLPLGKELRLDGALPEAPGLSVVGPATFPRSGAANPSLTTLTLARRHLCDQPADFGG